MAGTRITGLDPTTGVEGTDQLATAKGATDYRATVDEITSYVKDDITASELLTKIKTVDGVGSGLDSDLLQGLAASFFRDAGNLNAGTVGDDRLPNGATNPSWVGGGLYFNAGEFKDYIQIPEFFTGGSRYMIQFGWSNFTGDNATQTITFRTPFASGWGNENKPLVIPVPECRRDGWSGSIDGPFPRANVELDMRLWYSDLNGFRVSSTRTDGSGGDRVRTNWIALGKY